MMKKCLNCKKADQRSESNFCSNKCKRQFMEKKLEFVGNINNWMDFRDMLIKQLQECDTELKLNKIIFGLTNSMFSDIDRINEDRKTLGLKPLSKKEIEKLKKE